MKRARRLRRARARRSCPHVPTVAEQGYPGFRTVTWNGYVAPAATPREIVERIAREIAAGCKDAGFVERLNKIGVDAGVQHAGRVRAGDPRGPRHSGRKRCRRRR